MDMIEEDVWPHPLYSLQASLFLYFLFDYLEKKNPQPFLLHLKASQAFERELIHVTGQVKVGHPSPVKILPIYAKYF